MGQEGAKDRLDIISREPTWAKKVPRIDRHCFKRANLGQEGTKDRPDMNSREPTLAKKVPRVNWTWIQESQLGPRRF